MTAFAFLALATAWSLYLTAVYYVQHTRSAGRDAHISAMGATLGRMGGESADLQALLEDAKRNVADASRPREARPADLSVVRDRLATMTEMLDKLVQERASLSKRAEELERQVASLQADQAPLVAQLSERAVRRNSEVERAIALTGLDVDELLKAAPRNAADAGTAASGRGGLFVAYQSGNASAQGDHASHNPEIERIVAVFEAQEERHERLRKILTRLPLAAPLDDYDISSGFGKRIDPINGRLAMHPGVDLTSVPHAPVFATAPGKVVFAGWYGGYGKMVEIDHGMGIHTRYAHLRSTVVQPGTQIAAHTRIGIMGSTGRSLGAHVHYEVLVARRAYDPVKFMQVGKYVLDKD